MTWMALPQPVRLTPGTGSWSAATATIVADPGFEREAERLGGELADLGIGAGNGARILLRAEPGLGAEGFRIDVAADITVFATTATGAFRATRQLLHNLRAQGAVPHAHAESAPAVPQRGFHLDAARKYLPAAWIARLLHDLADVGVNVFQWHLSENEGVRLDFAAHPEIVSDDHITRDEAEALLALAADLHIEVIPSLDMPGHLRHALAAHPEWRLPGEDHALDITRPEAVRFALDLIDDIAPLFRRSTRWNLGADEFVDFARIAEYPTLVAAAHERFGPTATGFDLLTEFANTVAAHLRDLGFVALVWNDGMLRGDVVTLDERIQLAWWTNWHAQMAPLSRATGREVLNVNDSLFYYVLAENAGYRYPTSERIWDADWHPGLFPSLPGGVRQEIAAPYPDTLLGCAFAVWCDAPEALSPEQIADGVQRPVRAMAERAWNAGSQLSHDGFVALDAALPRTCDAAAGEPRTLPLTNLGDHHA